MTPKKQSEVQNIGVEGQFRHPVSKRVITGVRMPTGLKFRPECVYMGKNDWVNCPQPFLDGKTVLQCPNTPWFITSPTKKGETSKSD